MRSSTSAANQAVESSTSDVPAHIPEEREVSVENDSRSNEQRPSTEQPSRLRSPHTPRFAEATSVVSPIDPSSRSAFAEPRSNMTGSEPNATATPDVSDVGFGYVADTRASRHLSYPEIPQNAALRSNPPNSPLKSALKSPGTAGTKDNPLSPTFREEQILELHEKETEDENAKDVVRPLSKGTFFFFKLVVCKANCTEESESASPDSQILPSRRQFLLQPYHPGPGRAIVFHFQRYKKPRYSEFVEPLGARHEPMAPNSCARHSVANSSPLPGCDVRVLARWPSTSGES